MNYELAKKLRDAGTHRNIGSGAGLDKGDLAVPSINSVIEAKNQATVHLLNWWTQAKSQALHDQIPILAIRNPEHAEFDETLVVLSLPDMIKLIKGNSKQEISQSLSWEQKNKLQRLITAAKDIINHFDNTV